MDREFDDSSEPDAIDLLAEDYARRCRAGEQPPIDEYTTKYPELADEIRHLFPAVAFLEQGKGRIGQSSGSASSTGQNSGNAPVAPGLEKIGGYRVVRELGRGGMGVVYEAVDDRLGRTVAIKMLPRQASDDARSRERFEREARAIARLERTGIVPVFEVGEHNGAPYLVMKRIDGVGLDRVLSGYSGSVVLPADVRGRARWVAGLGLQAAEALAYAHGQGVLHRDVKPSNLLLDGDGKLWLADFGLAKLADDVSLTHTGDLPGTLRYLAPECLHGQADARSDVYSLGLTMYELLVGQAAYPESDKLRLLQQIGTQTPAPPSQLVRALPSDIETIVLTAMSREPSARYITAEALSDDLKRFLDGRPILARRPSLAGRAVRWIRRNPIAAALGTVSVVLAVSTAFFFALFLLAPPHPRWHNPGIGPGPEGPPPFAPKFDRPPPKFFPPRKGRPAPPPPPRKRRDEVHDEIDDMTQPRAAVTFPTNLAARGRQPAIGCVYQSRTLAGAAKPRQSDQVGWHGE